MARAVVFKFNSPGYVAIMKSPAVQAMLQDKANRVKAAVDAQYSAPGWEVIAEVTVGKSRARALVSGVPMNVEAAERIMGRALDAARS